VTGRRWIDLALSWPLVAVCGLLSVWHQEPVSLTSFVVDVDFSAAIEDAQMRLEWLVVLVVPGFRHRFATGA